MKRWTSRDARAKFCELIRKAGSEGPQVVTRRGADAVVLVSVEEWKRLKSAQKPDIKKLLIDDGPNRRFSSARPKKVAFAKAGETKLMPTTFPPFHLPRQSIRIND